MSSISRSSRPTKLPPLLRPGRAAFLLAALLLHLPLFLSLDRWIAGWMAEIDPGVVAVFQVVTVFGRSPPYLVATALVAAWYFMRAGSADRLASERLRMRLQAERASFVFVTVAFAGIVTNIVKVVAGRLRPSMLFNDGSYGFVPFSFDSTMRSFPSGHATTAFALALAFAALWPRYKAAWIGLGCLVAASRVIINAHYCGDVIGGMLVATLTMLVVRRFFAGRGLAFDVENGRYVAPDLGASPQLKDPGSR